MRSLLLLLANFAPTFDEIVIITDHDEPFDEGQLEELTEAGLTVRVTSELDGELPALDIIYQNAILWTGNGSESLGTRYQLNGESPLKPTAIILHPLARGPELSSVLDETPHNWYFAQARGAVFVRMALLVTIFKFFV